MSQRQPTRNFAPDFLTELFRDPLDPGYAAAAARRARSGPVSGWQRSTARAVRMGTLLVVGFLLAVAYLQTVAEEPSRAQARAGLVVQIKQRETDVDQLAERADRLRVEVARQRDAALSGTDAARLREQEAATGLVRVRGDGVVVQVSDAAVEADAVTGAGGVDLGRVLDRDLQDIANALWSVGAEAISINGQRLTSMSTIRAAGNTILVDFRPVTGPYEVSAIGPNDMERRFWDSSAARLLRRVSQEYGLGFQVRQVDDLTLPAASNPQLHYARPPTPSSERTTKQAPADGASLDPSGGGR